MRTILVSNSGILGENVRRLRQMLGMSEPEFCRHFDLGELMLEELEKVNMLMVYMMLQQKTVLET